MLLAGDARLTAENGIAGPPARRGGLLGLGLGRDLRDLDDRDMPLRRPALPGKSIGPPPTNVGSGIRTPRPQGENASYSQPDRRSMSLCTPHERSTVAGARMLSRLQEMRASEGIRRMFKPPEWEWSQFGDVGWWSRDGWGDVLLGAEGLRLDEWREQGRLTTIKSGPHRVVYRVDLPQGTIYVKHFLVPDWRATLRQWVRRGKGRNEGKRSQHLASIGVPTITPVALGERRKRKFLFENYLVTLAISSAIPLDEFVERHLPERPEPIRSQIRQKLAKAMAVMTARLHEAGLLHQDFHPGNIMVRLARRQYARALHDRSRRAAQEPPRDLEAGPAKPGAARPLLLAAQQSDRPLSFLENLPAKPVGAAAASAWVRPSDRGHDSPLGRAALAALGAALPVVEQVF